MHQRSSAVIVISSLPPRRPLAPLPSSQLSLDAIPPLPRSVPRPATPPSTHLHRHCESADTVNNTYRSNHLSQNGIILYLARLVPRRSRHRDTPHHHGHRLLNSRSTPRTISTPWLQVLHQLGVQRAAAVGDYLANELVAYIAAKHLTSSSIPQLSHANSTTEASDLCPGCPEKNRTTCAEVST